MFGVILICFAALGYAALGTRYLRAREPMIHHAAILSHDGVEVEEGYNGTFRAVYRLVGSVMLCLSVALIGLALFPVYRGETWAYVVIMILTGLMAYGGCLVQYRVELRTGVRMAWRPAAIVQVLILLGLLFS